MIYQNAILNIAGILISNIIITLGYIIVSRVLGPTKMGQYSYFIWMINISVLLASGGINMALSKYIPELRKRQKKEQVTIITRRLFLTGILLSLLAASFIAFIFPAIKHAQSYLTSLRLIALAIPFASMVTIFSAYLQGHNRFKLLSILTIITASVYALCVIIATLIYKEVNAVLLAYGLSYIICLLFNLYLLRPHIIKKNIHVEVDKKLVREISKYILSVSLIILFDTIIWDKSEVFFLKRYTQDQQVAFYTIAYTFVTKVSSLIPAALTTVLIPAYSALLDTTHEQNKVYYKSSKYLALFILPIACGGAALATPIIKYFLGMQYVGGIGTLRVLFLGCIFGVISSSGSALIYSVKKQNIILYVGFFLAVLSIGIDILIIPRFASIGAASANAFIQFLGSAIGVIYIIQRLNLTFPWKDIIKISGIAAIMGIIVFMYTYTFPNIFTFLSSILLGGFIYLGLILYFHILDQEDIALSKNILTYIQGIIPKKR